MYERLLRRVEDQAVTYGETLPAPCDGRSLAELRERVRDELGAELPGAYAGFLRLRDGLNWNGLFVYAGGRSPAAGNIEGFVEANLRYRDDDRFAGLLVFAEDGLDVYALRVSTREYQIFDQVPHNLIDTVPSFDALMCAALRRCLS